MAYRFFAWLAALAFLSGCEVPAMIAADANDGRMSGVTTISFPAKMMFVSDEDGEIFYDGEMKGQMSGAADFNVVNDRGERCIGRVEPSGMINMNCDGALISVDTGQKTKKSFSGANYLLGTVEGTRYETVFGWGKGADETVLRRSLALKRSLTPKEVRALNPD